MFCRGVRLCYSLLFAISLVIMAWCSYLVLLLFGIKLITGVRKRRKCFTVIFFFFSIWSRFKSCMSFNFINACFQLRLFGISYFSANLNSKMSITVRTFVHILEEHWFISTFFLYSFWGMKKTNEPLITFNLCFQM
jgi:hypothetical protein